MGTLANAAEEAIRKAAGDWKVANDHFLESLSGDDGLKERLLKKAVDRELRNAATRLGASTVPCPSCNEEVPLDSITCRFCGEDLDEPGLTSVPQLPARSAESGSTIRQFTWLTGWVLITLIIILIISFWN